MPLKFTSSKKTMSHQEARDTFDYDPATGWLTWKINAPHPRVKIGARAGSVKKGKYGDYRQINTGGRVYNEHRLIWMWWYGVWPVGELDHRDLDGTNNRIDNLRPATRSDNLMNKAVRKDNVMGVKGVRMTKNGRFTASITIDQKQRYLGTFDTEEDASAAFRVAVFARNPEFARAV